MNFIEKYLCKYGFHKWMDKDALKVINELLGIDGKYRKCIRCGRTEKWEWGLTEEYWWIENKGLEKHSGPTILKLFLIFGGMFLYIYAIFYRYL